MEAGEGNAFLFVEVEESLVKKEEEEDQADHDPHREEGGQYFPAHHGPNHSSRAIKAELEPSHEASGGHHFKAEDSAGEPVVKAEPSDDDDDEAVDCDQSVHDPAAATATGKAAEKEVMVDDRPIVCPFCPARFRKYGDLPRHLATHTKEKPFQCRLCDSRFARNYDLGRHTRTIHAEGGRTFTCRKCGHKTDTPDESRAHARTHLGGGGKKAHRCGQCKYRSARRADLARHAKNVHGIMLVVVGEEEEGEESVPRATTNAAGDGPAATTEPGKNATEDPSPHPREHASRLTGGVGDPEPEVKVHQCHHCDREWGSVAELREHVTADHATADNPFPCYRCAHAAATSYKLRLHERTRHEGRPPIVCIVFGREFLRTNTLKNHVMTHTGEKPFRCRECDHRARSRGDLKVHMRLHTGEKPYQCQRCDYRAGRSHDIVRHMKTHDAKKSFACELCDERFVAEERLIRHVSTAHTGEEKPFECAVCGHRFNFACNLRAHMRTHTDARPFQCQHCSHRSRTAADLRRHTRTHTGERPFQCRECDYAAATKSSLTQHMFTHTGEKPYQCPECDYRCGLPGTLRLHMVVHTGEKAFQCQQCGHKFKRSTCLAKHMETHKVRAWIPKRFDYLLSMTIRSSSASVKELAQIRLLS